MSLENLVLVTGGVLVGLHAGLLYDFSVDVVPSIRKLTAKAHIEMFQAIDKTITNALFFPSFFGPVLLLPLAAFLFRDSPQFLWLVAASIVQIIFCNGATVIGNLPLNAKLAKAFGKGGWFTVLLVLLPFIGFPILGFGSAKYKAPKN